MTPTPPPPQPLAPEELYDEIMGQIEPDLTAARIEHLDEFYAGETPDQRAARFAAYDQAFTIFDEVLEKMHAESAKSAHEWKAQIQKKMHRREETEHARELSNVERSFDADTEKQPPTPSSAA